MNNILPDSYRGVPDGEFRARITKVKERLGSKLCILGHYYQRDEVIAFADFQGDSFALAKEGAATSADSIVFCGVRFMAEASVILARPGQRVFLPDPDAGCPLADMAEIDQVEEAWAAIERAGLVDRFVPITYMNSSAALKAFCGGHGGTVCTSSSAGRAFDWAAAQEKRILFFPDENLGRNTAHAKGITDAAMALWDPLAHNGGVDVATLAEKQAVLWKGFCHVHTFFTVAQVEAVRRDYPGCRVVVHPEASPAVVDACDGNGSTAYLKEYVEAAPAGATIVVGTEINMVARLARQHPEKRVVPLARSLCPNMFKTSLADLCWTLESLGEVNEVFVEEGVARDAKRALDRMLAL